MDRAGGEAGRAGERTAERAGGGEGETEWERPAPYVARRRLPGWDATAGLVVGDGGVLLVDAGSTRREGAGLRRQARKLTGQDVTHLALTHPHFDHVLGAAAFPQARVHGAAGLDRCLRDGLEALREDAVRHGVDRREAAEATEAAEALVHPHRLVTGAAVLDLGGGVEAVLADVGPGHTAHDLAVLVPGRGGAPDVVFCGDLVEESGPPQAGPDAVPDRWPAALDRLLALGGEAAVYVPGHGALVDAAFVRAQREELLRRLPGA